ncbi:hypothetical protein DEO72_LG3g1039 [Vigna unguiculata]|uniref:Uncharacterized protein n=1 Tax=Vigna unguiculata TaxID=3917 RepID=A0A4D6LDN8_VIGUN|nr:hypothetical protein DEO72_LG3g1039 [Vigna unguiculata]
MEARNLQGRWPLMDGEFDARTDARMVMPSSSLATWLLLRSGVLANGDWRWLSWRVDMVARVSSCVEMKMMTWDHVIGSNSLVEIKPTRHVLVGQFLRVDDCHMAASG